VVWNRVYRNGNPGLRAYVRIPMPSRFSTWSKRGSFSVLLHVGGGRVYDSIVACVYAYSDHEAWRREHCPQTCDDRPSHPFLQTSRYPNKPHAVSNLMQCHACSAMLGRASGEASVGRGGSRGFEGSAPSPRRAVRRRDSSAANFGASCRTQPPTHDVSPSCLRTNYGA
jgi:hypothetical protein